MHRENYRKLKNYVTLLFFCLPMTLKATTVVLPGEVIPPGTGIVTIPAVDTYVQEPGGIYLVEMNDQGSSNRIVVTGNPGTAAISGGILELQFNQYDYLLNSPYTILTATGGINGEFGSVISNLNSTLLPALSYNSNVIFLTLGTNFSTLATSENQLQVSRVLDNNQNAQGDFLFLIQNLLATSDECFPEALDELSGQQYSSVFQVARQTTRRFQRDLFDPLLFGSFAFSEECCDIESCSSDLEMWQTVHYGRSFLNGNNGGRGYKITFLDALVAFQKKLTFSSKLGLAAFYENDKVNYNLNGNASVNSIQGAIYGIYENECLYGLANLSFGFHHFNLNREINFIQLHRTTKGKPKVYDAAFYTEWGYNFRAGECLKLQPFVGIDGGFFWYNAFKESGGSSINLSANRKNQWTCDSRVGLRAIASLPFETIFSFNIAWDHAFCKDITKNKFRFDAVGQTFIIHGSKQKQNAVEGSLYLGKKIFRDTTLFAEAAGASSGNFSSYSLLLGLDFSI